MSISNQQKIINTIIEYQSFYKITDLNLCEGILPTIRWWRIRNNKAELTFDEAIQLLARVRFDIIVSQERKEIKLIA